MPIANSSKVVRVSEDSVARLIVNPRTTYSIDLKVDKSNVRMGMIALPQGFPGSTTSYYHQEFTVDSQPFQWTPHQDGIDFSLIYFYLLLPWSGDTLPTHMEPNKVQYAIGLNDGEVGDLPGNRVAGIQVYLKNARTQSIFGDVPDNSYILPAEIIEFAQNYHISVEPARGPSGDNLEWAEITVTGGNTHPNLELKTRIHIISGRNGNDIMGIVKPGVPLAHSVPLGPMLTANNNINLFALVAPTVNPNDPNDFSFEVGDPERDGKVTIRRI